MGTELWLPSEVRRENAELQEQLDTEVEALAYWTKALQQIDPYLSVVMAKMTVTVDGMKPGYYHIIRQTGPNSPVYIKPVENPDGTWRDLDSRVIEQAQEDDLWNDRTQRERRKIREQAEAARQRQMAREKQDRIDELNRRWHSANSVSIAIPRSI